MIDKVQKPSDLVSYSTIRSQEEKRRCERVGSEERKRS
jgi:hypothetical protein